MKISAKRTEKDVFEAMEGSLGDPDQARSWVISLRGGPPGGGCKSKNFLDLIYKRFHKALNIIATLRHCTTQMFCALFFISAKVAGVQNRLSPKHNQ